MFPSRPIRLAAPVLAAALLLAPALRLVCDTVCAESPAPAATHCAGGDPSDPAHRIPAGKHDQPNGCRHSDDVVLAKASGGSGGGTEVSLLLADLVSAFGGALPQHFALARNTHRRPPPSAASHAPAVLRL